MRTWLFISIVLMAFVAIACAPSAGTFLIYKDGYGVFVGSNSDAKYNMLCASGDMEKVLEISHLNQETKDALFKYNCSAERSGEKIKQIYAAMTPEQRKDIRRAFRTNGYEINYMAC